MCHQSYKRKKKFKHVFIYHYIVEVIANKFILINICKYFKAKFNSLYHFRHQQLFSEINIITNK